MPNPTNREAQVTVSVVPSRFTPAAEQFARPLSQELRSLQARLAHGYTLRQISFLENQLHLPGYKRVEGHQKTSEESLKKEIGIAKTARTKMMDDIPTWAGTLDETELQSALPHIWGEYVQAVRSDMVPDASKVLDTSGEEEPAPIQVINRPVVSEDAPRSSVEAPRQLTLGEILEKAEKDNREDK